MRTAVAAADIQVFNVADPYAMYLDGSASVSGDARGVTASGNRLFVVNSSEHMLTYDLSVSYDKNRLIKSLDGRTGYEVLQRVRWGKPAPGKGPAEKGAADAKRGNPLAPVSVIVPTNATGVTTRRWLGRHGGVAAIELVTAARLAERIAGAELAAAGLVGDPAGGGAPIAFGGAGEPTINQLLSGTYDPGTGVISRAKAARSSVTTTPLPAARPSALTTIGAPCARR